MSHYLFNKNLFCLDCISHLYQFMYNKNQPDDPDTAILDTSDETDQYELIGDKVYPGEVKQVPSQEILHSHRQQPCDPLCAGSEEATTC